MTEKDAPPPPPAHTTDPDTTVAGTETPGPDTPEVQDAAPTTTPQVHTPPVDECQDKLKRALADYDNLQKSTALQIRREVDNRLDACFLDFLQIYDDFARARQAYEAAGTDTAGLDSILKNMDSFLAKHGVAAIDALGRAFDPNCHEAISTTSRPDVEEGTITAEIRRGYTSHNRIIRPTLVEISKIG